MLLDDTLRTLVAGRLRGFERQVLSTLPGSRRAAVALALIEEGTGAALPGFARRRHGAMTPPCS